MHRWLYLAALLFALPAQAQFLNCSQTVAATAAPVAFVANFPPRHYVEICNAHATQTLGINPSGGTAAIGAAGTRTLAAGACWLWKDQVPGVISVIGSGAGTTTACQYQ